MAAEDSVSRTQLCTEEACLITKGRTTAPDIVVHLIGVSTPFKAAQILDIAATRFPSNSQYKWWDAKLETIWESAGGEGSQAAASSVLRFRGEQRGRWLEYCAPTKSFCASFEEPLSISATSRDVFIVYFAPGDPSGPMALISEIQRAYPCHTGSDAIFVPVVDTPVDQCKGSTCSLGAAVRRIVSTIKAAAQAPYTVAELRTAPLDQLLSGKRRIQPWPVELAITITDSSELMLPYLASVCCGVLFWYLILLVNSALTTDSVDFVNVSTWPIIARR